MSTQPWRPQRRRKKTNKKQVAALQRLVQETQASIASSVNAEVPVGKSGLVESLRAENVILHHKNDALTTDLLTAAGRIAELEIQIAAFQAAAVECRILIDVKAPELASHRNAGWQVKHYEFVDNDRSLPVLAVVMERPVVAATDLLQQEEVNIQPEASTPLNFAATQPVEIVFDDILTADEPEPVNEPELVPSMDATGITIEPAENSRNETMLKKLAQDKPIFAAILERCADAVIADMNAQVMDTFTTAYEAALPPDSKPWRFESKLLTSSVEASTCDTEPGAIILENEAEILVQP